MPSPAGLTLFFLWGATWGRTSIRVSEVEICSDHIPEAFDGYRFVQISDIHVGTIVRPKHDLARLAECINSLHPDAVFFTGDLVNIRAEELDDRTRTLLRQIEGPVWSVTGNHDVGTYIKDSVRFPAAVQAREVVARQRSMGGACWKTRPSTCGAAQTASRSRGFRSTPRCVTAATTAIFRLRRSDGLMRAFPIRSSTSRWSTCRSSGGRFSKRVTAI